MNSCRAGPHVGAVARHHERQVAEHAARRPRPATRLPLPLGDPLQVGAIAPLLAERGRGLAHRRRIGEGQGRRPVPPRPFLVARRGSRGTSRRRRATTTRWLRRRETPPPAACRAPAPRRRSADTPAAAIAILSVADLGVADARRGPHPASEAPVGGVERRLAAQGGEVRHVGRRGCRSGRAPSPTSTNRARSRPARSRSAAGAARSAGRRPRTTSRRPAGRRTRRCPSRAWRPARTAARRCRSAARRTRVMPPRRARRPAARLPASNTAGSGSRLSTTNASRAKSKK